jgi:hypothetical protein
MCLEESKDTPYANSALVVNNYNLVCEHLSQFIVFMGVVIHSCRPFVVDEK